MVGTAVEKVDSSRLIFQPFGTDRIGQRIQVRAAGPGDPAGGCVAEYGCIGAGMAPLAPCHVAVHRDADGGLVVSWVPRERRFIDWSESVGPSPDMYFCRFASDVVAGAGTIEKRVQGLTLVYSAADQIADFGMVLGQFSLSILAAGDGPEAIRAAEYQGVAAA